MLDARNIIEVALDRAGDELQKCEFITARPVLSTNMLWSGGL